MVGRAGGGKRGRTREKLISAAAAIIGEKGYDRASLEEIAARAGMTRGAVYGNFKNKEELFLALIASRWKPIVPPLKPGASLKEQLHILGETVAKEAQARRSQAAAATAFQLYAPDARADAVPSVKTERGHLSAHGKGITEGRISERAAHVSREVCPHTGCNDYGLPLHVFSNAETDDRRHYHRRIRSAGLKDLLRPQCRR